MVFLLILPFTVAVVYFYKLRDAVDKCSNHNRERNDAESYITAVIRKKKTSLKTYLHEKVYIPNRSLISLMLRFPSRNPPFTCEVCQLRLGLQDYDRQYQSNCRCRGLRSLKTCKYCIGMDLLNQVVGRRASTLLCLGRKCTLDDRFVRQRLDAKGIAILDRNQIEFVMSDSTNCRCGEKCWRCPTPDCRYVAFIPSNISSEPPSRSTLQRIFQLFTNVSSSDPRAIRCPACKVSSCQFCGKVWSKGMALHEFETCEKYSQKLGYMDDKGDHSLQIWIKNTAKDNAQRCPACKTLIEKNAGCKHMTCRCKYEFCWICNEKWRTGHNSVSCQRKVQPSPIGMTANNNERASTWFGFLFR